MLKRVLEKRIGRRLLDLRRSFQSLLPRVTGIFREGKRVRMNSALLEENQLLDVRFPALMPQRAAYE